MHARLGASFISSAIIIFVSILVSLVVPAAVYASLYAPGTTTDPACAPTDTNCGISGLTATGTIGQIPYYAAAGDILSATSSITILTNGFVGIGTTSPYSLFSVAGQIIGSYFTATSNTTSFLPYASSTALTVSGNSYLGTIVGPTLTGTTTNSGTISGGTVDSHIVQHCTTITDLGGTPTTLPNETSNSFPGGAYTLVHMDTILTDPDHAADLTNSQIKVPSWANYVQVSGHIDFPVQTNGNGYASMHLFRDNTPTITDAYYHTRVYYPASATSTDYITTFGGSPVIPVQGPNETWQLYAWQDSGGPVTIGTPGTWLEVCFYP